MNKFRLILAGLVCVFSFAMVSCDLLESDDEVFSSYDKSSLSILLTSEGVDNYEFSFTATQGWEASSSQSWVTLDQKEGDAGVYTVNLTVEANSTGLERYAYVYIMAESETLTIKVTQSADSTLPDTEDTQDPDSGDGGIVNDASALTYVTGRWETGTAESYNGSSLETYWIFELSDDYTFTESEGSLSYNGDELVDSTGVVYYGTFVVDDEKIGFTYTNGDKEYVEMGYSRFTISGFTTLRLSTDNGDGTTTYFYFIDETSSSNPVPSTGSGSSGLDSDSADAA